MKRICTNRDFFNKKSGSYECIDIDDNGVFWWYGIDIGWIEFEDICIKYVPINVEDIQCRFMVDLQFVKDFFHNINRNLDINLLPENYVTDPYKQWR